MNPDSNPHLISVPFGSRIQSVTSARYFWDNNRVADEQFVIVQWTFEGSGIFVREGKEWEVPPGHAFIALVPEDSRYYFPKQATKPWKFSWINFYGPVAISIIQSFQKSFGPVIPLPRRSVAGGMFLRLAEHAEKRSFQDIYEVSAACYAFLMEWTRQLSVPTHEKRDRVETVTAMCRSRFREPLGIKELAAETGLTREHLTRIFTAKMGISPGCYLRNLRVDAARQMLTGQETPLKEVALRSGFPSVRSLNKALTRSHTP